MRIGDLITYLKIHAAPLKSGQKMAREREEWLAFLDDAVQETAKILIQQREPNLFMEWRFNIVNGKVDYALYTDIAPGSAALQGIDNLGRFHSLWILSKTGQTWFPYKLQNEIEAMIDADPQSTKPWPIAHVRLVSGHGGATGTEGDVVITIENPPDYDLALGGRLGVFVLPTRLVTTVSDDFQPALPAFAWQYAKKYALRAMYLADGNEKGYGMLDESLKEAEITLRAHSGGSISDEPVYVQDVQAEERGGVVPGGWT
jgi:hypothetical protein